MHAHDHERGHGHASPRGALGAALTLTLAFAGVEVVVGLWSGSLALLADAGHMLGDSAALALSLMIAWIAERPPSAAKTFGYRRAEVLGAMINGAALIGIAVWIVLEAVERLGAPRDIRGVGMLLTAALGLLVNAAAAAVLFRSARSNLNVRAALLHVLGDALGSVAALVAGALVLFAGIRLADPVASIVIAALILVGAVRLLRETTHVLMQGAPSGLDPAEIQATIASIEGVESVHDLHVWCLTPNNPVLTAHVVLRPGYHGVEVVRAVCARLEHEHHIHHATIQPEAPLPDGELVPLRTDERRVS